MMSQKRYLICMLMLLSLFSVNSIAQNNTSYIIKQRIEKLNKETPIKLDYNKYVQAYIDAYTIKQRKHLSNIISRSKLYFPLFEEFLDKYNLPLELKYLPVIESALDPRAKSPSGAMGLWQFMYHSGTMFNLKISSYTDERCDPLLSTDAACRYLKYLYRNLKDWQLALAAYNGGIGAVKKAIERSGGQTDYWKIRPYMTKQMQGYVPAFIAAFYSIKYANNYNITYTKPDYTFDNIDTVAINKKTDFSEIVDRTGVSMSTLEKLNPTFTKGIIPSIKNRYYLFLPQKYISPFVKSRARPLFEKMERKSKHVDLEKVIHIVSKGEYFHTIAIKHNCTVDEIMKWNHLSSKTIYPGQKLTIWITKKEPFFFITNKA